MHWKQEQPHRDAYQVVAFVLQPSVQGCLPSFLRCPPDFADLSLYYFIFCQFNSVKIVCSHTESIQEFHSSVDKESAGSAVYSGTSIVICMLAAFIKAESLHIILLAAASQQSCLSLESLGARKD